MQGTEAHIRHVHVCEAGQGLPGGFQDAFLLDMELL